MLNPRDGLAVLFLSSYKMVTVTRVQILNEAVRISHNANTFWEGPSSYG